MIRTWGVSIDYRLDIVALVFHGGSLWFLISWYKLSHGVGSCVESLKRWKISGVSRGRMRSLVSSLVIAWMTLLGIKAQKIKVWKMAKKTWPFYQPRFTSYPASAPGQTRLTSNGSRFQLSRSLRFQFVSGEVWAKTSQECLSVSEENHLCRYFQDSLPFGSGPGTDTDLVSVMNGEGNRRFDEVF